MKCLIVLCAVLAMTTAESEWKPRTREQFYKDAEDCLKSESFLERDVKLRNVYIMSEETECIYRCHAIKGNTWDDATGYNIDRTYEELTNVGRELTKSNLEKCNTEEKNVNEPCKWANGVVKCMLQNKFIKSIEV